VRVLITGVTGYLGWRTALLLGERGHDVVGLTRPGAARRAASAGLEAVAVDAGDPAAREHIAGCDAVVHFAGVPDPARAAADPAGAVRQNAGTTLNLLEGCAEHGAGLIYPSTARAGLVPLPDAYGASKRLGEVACLEHAADATVLRLTSVFGPGQVRSEGATGAIAAFADRALRGQTITIPGTPERTRDFLYVDDLIAGIEGLLAERRWGELLYAGSGVATPLVDAARLVCDAVGAPERIELTGEPLPAGEDASYALDPRDPRLGLPSRPLREAVERYVDWLRQHPSPEGRGAA
jgi:nucleoside-diphosphate-sugar epimerase